MHRLVVVVAVCTACIGVAALVTVRPNLEYTNAPITVSTVKTPGRATTFIFGGDIMLDRTVRTALERNGEDALFSCLDAALASADYTVANLEGPITNNFSMSVGSVIGSPENYVFTFSLSTAALLARHHMSAVSLGNNHILNFGRSGLDSTLAVLDAAGVASFGEPYGHRIARMPGEVGTFSLIGYNEFDPAGWRAAASTTVEQIHTEAAALFIPIVFAHWGEEYSSTTPRQRALAKEFVSAGARLILGAHPHVIQDHEYMGAVPVYYSLGNFVFDQYWNESVRTGLLLAVSFATDGTIQTQEMPIRIGPGGRPCLVE